MTTVRLEFKLADCWIGAFWRVHGEETHLWVCLLPCLPLHFTWNRARRCEHRGCRRSGLRCALDPFGDEDENLTYLCREHAKEGGYCGLCGAFAAGLETFEFGRPPGYCDECRMQVWDQERDEADDDDFARDWFQENVP